MEHNKSRLITTCLLAVSIALTFGVAAYGQVAGDNTDRLPVIAASGTNEVAAIEVNRWQSSRQDRTAILSHMKVSLWFATKSDEDRPASVLVQLVELDPIYDNTGKLVTTKRWLDAMPFLKKDYICRESQSWEGKTGPVIHLVVDVPTREATTIKSIKGKAVVSRFDPETIDFQDLTAIHKKPLDDPKLKDFKIVPDIKVEDGNTTLTLRVPADHQRLLWWGLVSKARKPLPIFAEEKNGSDEKPVLAKTYNGDQTKKSYLGIVIAEPIEPRTVEFHFHDFALP